MKTHVPILLLSILFATSAAAQTDTRKPLAPEAWLVDFYQDTNSEEKVALFDRFFAELAKEPTAIGYVNLYCGKTCM